MKTGSKLLSLLVLISTLGVAGCAAPATLSLATEAALAPQALPTQPPPTQAAASQPISQNELNEEIVLDMVGKLNGGDVEASLAYFADDAIGYIVGLPPAGMEVYAGKERIRSLWEDSVSNHFRWEVEIESASGNLVNIRAKTWHDFTRQLEVAPLEYIDVYEIKDGLITTYGSTITEKSLASFRLAFAEAITPESTATPSSGSPASELIVTIAGGTCTTDGPITLQAGDITVTLDVQDQDNALYALTIFNLDADKDLLDLMVSTTGTPPPWAHMLLMEELPAGESAIYTLTLEKGPLYLICWSQPPALPIGNAGPFAVVP